MSALANDLSRLNSVAAGFMREQHAMWIDGASAPAIDGQRRELIDPSSGVVVASVAQGGADDADRAVQAARRAFAGPWSRFRPYQREALMLKLADLIAAHGETLAQIESVNSGRLLVNARLFDVELSVRVSILAARWGHWSVRSNSKGCCSISSAVGAKEPK